VIYYFKGQRSAGLIDQADHHLPAPPQAPGGEMAPGRGNGPDGGSTSGMTSYVGKATGAGPNSATGPATLDLHGGWYNATGDYGIHLSHLSFSSYFNPQQVSLTVWSLLKTERLLAAREGTDFRQFRRRLFDEAMYGTDYLVRV